MILPAEPRRVSADEALALLGEDDLPDLARRADAVTRRLHPEPYRTFAIDRNVNFSNLCECRCRFCAFWRGPGDGGAYVLDEAALFAKIEEAVGLGATHILGQGGLWPEFDLAYYEALLRRVRARFDIRLHCFSPPEVQHLARRAGLPVRTVLERLRAAGLDSLPGGGAEILVDRVRRLISPRKCTAEEWLDVMRTAHALGMPTTATMVFGHVETPAERIEHLARLRDLQDETGGFLSFIAWPFQAANTALAAGGDLGPDWRPVGGAEYLRLVAVARLFLDNIPNIQASWVTMGPRVGQVALVFGANDLGSTMIEENVVAAAGCVYRASPEMLRRLIEAAGFQAQQRNSRYQTVGP
ncbi:MAG TPA: cyclic dehypoxanthinyl futalosine synthase [Phycisphaerae bacterium]|nr:cyclic dehypoxanthinyl futalosine synthase [Phycisphaerae bacterium]